MAVIKNEEKLSAIGAEALQRMRMPSGEIPEIALVEIVHETTTVGVQCCDTDSAFEHVSPLGLGMPMQLADDAFI